MFRFKRVVDVQMACPATNYTHYKCHTLM